MSEKPGAINPNDLVTMIPGEGFIPYKNLLERQAQAVVKVTENAKTFGLNLKDDVIRLIASLDTPARLQEFYDNPDTFNGKRGQEDKADHYKNTVYAPTKVLRDRQGNCFEGAALSHLVLTLHGYSNFICLLVAAGDQDHNICAWFDDKTSALGAVSVGLTGRAAKFTSLRSLAKSYVADYTMENDSYGNRLVSYSDPINFFQKFGPSWANRRETAWDMYLTYVDDAVKFHDIHDPYIHKMYPLYEVILSGLVTKVKNGWQVNEEKMPHAAWRAYALWKLLEREHEATQDLGIRTMLRAVELNVFKLLGVTPYDLEAFTEESLPEFSQHRIPLSRVLHK